MIDDNLTWTASHRSVKLSGARQRRAPHGSVALCTGPPEVLRGASSCSLPLAIRIEHRYHHASPALHGRAVPRGAWRCSAMQSGASCIAGRSDPIGPPLQFIPHGRRGRIQVRSTQRHSALLRSAASSRVRLRAVTPRSVAQRESPGPSKSFGGPLHVADARIVDIDHCYELFYAESSSAASRRRAEYCAAKLRPAMSRDERSRRATCRIGSSEELRGASSFSLNSACLTCTDMAL